MEGEVEKQKKRSKNGWNMQLKRRQIFQEFIVEEFECSAESAARYPCGNLLGYETMYFQYLGTNFSSL